VTKGRGLDDDEALLKRAEEALTEIKVAHGLREEHQAVLAALRIRLKGAADKSLEEMLTAADDAADEPPSGTGLDSLLDADAGKKKTTLDDLFAQQPKKPEWPGG
jgi:hypothetical protein